MSVSGRLEVHSDPRFKVRWTWGTAIDVLLMTFMMVPASVAAFLFSAMVFKVLNVGCLIVATVVATRLPAPREWVPAKIAAVIAMAFTTLFVVPVNGMVCSSGGDTASWCRDMVLYERIQSYGSEPLEFMFDLGLWSREPLGGATF
jgi:hypothetical protein